MKKSAKAAAPLLPLPAAPTISPAPYCAVAAGRGRGWGGCACAFRL